MAIITKRDLKKMTKKDRMKRLRELQTELFKMRTEVAGGGTINSPGKIREIRKTIARINTFNHIIIEEV